MFTEEAPGVFSVASQFVDGMNSVVIGTRGAVAIDCSNYLDEAESMATLITENGHAVDRLALTHGHGDHVLGALPLIGGEVYAHRLTPAKIASQLTRFAEKWETTEQDARSRLPWPTVTYSEELWLDLGDKHLWMFPTPGHSDDGVSIYVEEDRLLYSGDSVVNGIVAAIGDGDSRILETSLTRLLEVDIKVLVPGHGHTIEGRDAVQDWLTWQGGYLRAVRDKVREMLSDGASAVATAEAVTYGDFIGERLPVDRHGMPKRHRNTVDKIVQEELAPR